MSHLNEHAQPRREPSAKVVRFDPALSRRTSAPQVTAIDGKHRGDVIHGRFGPGARSRGDASRDRHDHPVGDGDSGARSLSRVPRVLIVDHDIARCSELGELFTDFGYDAFESSSPAQAEGWWRHLQEVDVVLLDLNLPERGAFSLLDKLLNLADTEHRYPPAVVVLARRDQRTLALEAMHEGAFDWQETPLDIALLGLAIARAAEHVRLSRVDRMFQHLLSHSV